MMAMTTTTMIMRLANVTREKQVTPPRAFTAPHRSRALSQSISDGSDEKQQENKRVISRHCLGFIRA